MKAQTSSFIKILFIVISAIAFTLVIVYFSSFKKSTIEEREAANFKMDVLNILQKLTTDKDCLAYQYNETSKKIVLDKDKLDSYSYLYSQVEPENAKALNFDYNIKVFQPEHSFKFYPGETMVQGELTLSNEFSSHSWWGWPGGDGGNQVVYFDCNFNPKEHPELCQNTELDSIICSDCMENPREKCPYDEKKRICCVYFNCPKDACGSVEVKTGMGDCGSGCTVAKDCDLSRCTNSGGGHGACGMTYEYIWIPTGETTYVNIEKKIWSFGISAGVQSFSPEKAKTEELEISLPVTIRHNETFSSEGVLYIHAVRGELESFNSQLEDICEKATKNKNQDIKFSRQFHFSYPVTKSEYKIVTDVKNFKKKLAMLINEEITSPHASLINDVCEGKELYGNTTFNVQLSKDIDLNTAVKNAVYRFENSEVIKNYKINDRGIKKISVPIDYCGVVETEISYHDFDIEFFVQKEYGIDIIPINNFDVYSESFRIEYTPGGSVGLKEGENVTIDFDKYTYGPIEKVYKLKNVKIVGPATYQTPGLYVTNLDDDMKECRAGLSCGGGDCGGITFGHYTYNFKPGERTQLPFYPTVDSAELIITCNDGSILRKLLVFNEPLEEGSEDVFQSITESEKICMLDSCKNFHCKYKLEFSGIETKGDHLLNFEFDSDSETIKVV